MVTGKSAYSARRANFIVLSIKRKKDQRVMKERERERELKGGAVKDGLMNYGWMKTMREYVCECVGELVVVVGGENDALVVHRMMFEGGVNRIGVLIG